MLYSLKQKTSIPLGLAFGWIVNLAITLLSAIFVSILVAGERVGENLITPAAVITVMIASFLGAIVAAKRVGQRRLIICLASGAIYYLSLLCCTALFFDGKYEGLGAAALTIIGCSAVAGLLGLRQKRQKMKGLQKRYRA